MKKLIIMVTILLAMVLSTSVTKADIGDPLELGVTYRDFYDTHPDFEDYISGLETGIVQTTLVSGKPVYAGDTASTHGQPAFDQWYRDVAGVNLSKTDSLIFTENADGNYEYISSSFFPIDDELFGNQDRTHNYHFTMELHTTFTYEQDQEFDFTGDDDVWVFINNQLVIDLGGVHGALSASIDLDTLGLTEGDNYTFDLFFAERHTSQSNFQAETNIAFGNPVVPVPGALLLGLLGFGATGIKLRKFA